MDLLRHLKYFLAVADELSFVGAARRLGMAQPPLTQRVQRLELELGVKLFDRSHRQIQLTAEGTALVPEARRLLDSANDLHQRINEPTRIQALRVGMPNSQPPGSIVHCLELFERQTGVRLEVSGGSPHERANRLAVGGLDAAMLPSPPPWSSTTSSVAFQMGIARKAAVTDGGEREAAVHWHPSDLGGHRLITVNEFGDDLGPDGLAAQLLRRGGASRSLSIHSDLNIAVAAAMAGHGLLLIDSVTARRYGLHWEPFLGDPLFIRQRFAWSSTTYERSFSTQLQAAFGLLFDAPSTTDQPPSTDRAGWGL